jgi:hypothetical protein
LTASNKSTTTSPLLTLFGRAVRRDFFIRGPHFGRIALLALISFQVLATVPRSWSFGQGWNPTGGEFFAMLCVLDLIFISIASILFATLIAGEKEERTLDMLRLTGAAPQVLLGVSWPGLVSAALLFLVQYPFFNLAAHLGGIIPRQILIAYCGLFSFLLFAWSLALFASVMCGNSSSAMILYCVSLALYLFGGPLGKILLGQYTSGLTPYLPPDDFSVRCLRWSLEMGSHLSAFEQLGFLSAGPFAEPVCRLQTLLNLVLSACLFAGSCLRFESTAARISGSAKGVKAESRPHQRRLFRRYQLGVGRVWSNPLLWKDFHFIAGGWAILGVKCLFYAALGWLIAIGTAAGPRSFDELLFGALAILAIIAFVFEILHIAGLTFRTEVKERTLAGIMVLPHSTRWIAYSKVAGGLIAVLPASGVACLAVCGVFYHGLTSQQNYVFERIAAHWGWGLVILIEFFVWGHRNAALQGLPLAQLNGKFRSTTAARQQRHCVVLFPGGFVSAACRDDSLVAPLRYLQYSGTLRDSHWVGLGGSKAVWRLFPCTS